MKYLLHWDFEDGKRRYWSGFGAGYTTSRKNARVFPDIETATREADKVHKGRKTGASIRPCQS